MPADPTLSSLNPLIQSSSHSLDAWIESHHFQGWDPFDALNSPLLKRLTFGSRRLGQLWVQLFKRSPFNLRRVFGVSQGCNPKAMGLFLASYLRKYLRKGSAADLEKVQFFFDWLGANASHGWHGPCWGYNFDWPNRGFFAPAGTPTIVNTAFIGLACMDMVQLAGPQGRLDDGLRQRALAMATGACDFIQSDLNRCMANEDEICFSYTPIDRRFIHNANVLGAWLLARVAVRTDAPELKRLALASARYSARRLRPDGFWPYGEGRADAWVDNFHTGYVLVALHEIGILFGTDEFAGSLRHGYNTWKVQFFTKDGAPKYYPASLYPLDVHCAAQAVCTFLEFSGEDPQSSQYAYRVAKWVVENMQSPEGFFHYQIHPTYRIRIPYMRWSQAWMQRAFAELDWCEQ
jgi:hypothetical protein